jgi:type III pantothenate kinase
MNLVIDWGNTFIKAGRFSGDTLVENFTIRQEAEVLAWLEAQKPEYVLVSSVGEISEKFFTESKKYSEISYLTPETSLPIQNLYSTPRTLGMDRLASAVGAFHLFPGQSCLIIDAGTCITLDFLDAQGSFQGGNITLGLQMRFKALKEFTAKLPLVTIDAFENTTLTGKSTQEAIYNGVVNGLTGEILFTVEQYRNLYPNLCVLLCGGDAEFLASRLKVPIFATPTLNLIGLNRILQDNVPQNL